MTAEMIRKQMTDVEWQKIYEMSQDRNLYQNIISSLFPTIHGQYTTMTLSILPCHSVYYHATQDSTSIWIPIEFVTSTSSILC